MFYNLLSVSNLTAPYQLHHLTPFQWQNPRATSIAFLVNVAAIFAARYIPILHYITKALYLTLGGSSLIFRAMQENMSLI